MPNLVRQLQQKGGDERIDIGRKFMALGMAIMDPAVNTAGIESQAEQFLDKHSALVDRKLSSLESRMNAYLSSYRKLETEMESNPQQSQKIVTPDSAKSPSQNVLEVAASVNVPAVNEGDKESVGLFEGRETHRDLGERMPENSHSEMRGITMTASLQPSFQGAYMDTVKLSAEDAEMLEGLN